MPKKYRRQTLILAVIFILFAIIVASSILLIRELWFEQRAEKLSLHNAYNKTVERETVVREYLDQSEDYLLFLRQSELFNTYLNTGSNAPELEAFFQSYMTVNPYFMRLRYIDAAGNEIIRIDRDAADQPAYINHSAVTENIAERYYFTEPQQNGLEQVWYSAFDLNLESNAVSTPYQPTFRAVLPLEHSGAFDGVLMINFFVDDFLENLTNTPLYDMILYNDDGTIIYHYDLNSGASQNAWGDLLSRQVHLSEVFPEGYQTILASQSLETDNYVSHHLDLPVAGGLNMLLQMKATYLETEQERQTNENTAIFMIVLLFSSLLTALILKLFSRTLLNQDELQRLNSSLSQATRIAKIGFWELDPVHQQIKWNEGVAEIYNMDDPAEISFESFINFLPPEERSHVAKVYQDSVDQKCEFSVTHQINTADHQVKYVEERGRHYYRKNGQHIKTIGSVYDVTDKFFTNKKYEMMLNNASDGILFMNLLGELLEFSKKSLELLGYTAEEMAEMTVFDWDRDLTTEVWASGIEILKKKDLEMERTHVRKDGTTFIAHVTASMFEIGSETFIYSSFRDITRMKQTQKELEDSKLRWQFAVEGSRDGLWDWNLETGEVFLSDQFKKILGYESDALADSMTAWQQLIHPDDRKAYQQALNKYCHDETDHYLKEYRILTRQGQYIWIRDKAVIVERNEAGGPRRLIGTHTDITEYIRAMELIRKQSYTDELTQLHNRKAYNQKLDEIMEQFRRYQFPFSLLIFDLDYFKRINDNYGHDKGDVVLSNLGKLLKTLLRKNDYIFRIGGEEFIILLSGTGLDQAELFAEKVRSAVEQKLAGSVGLADPITISIGVVTVTATDTSDSIFKRADLCLYQAKGNGRNQVVAEDQLGEEI